MFFSSRTLPASEVFIVAEFFRNADWYVCMAWYLLGDLDFFTWSILKILCYVASGDIPSIVLHTILFKSTVEPHLHDANAALIRKSTLNICINTWLHRIFKPKIHRCPQYTELIIIVVSFVIVCYVWKDNMKYCT